MRHKVAADNGGRRSGINRRQCSFSDYTPERRNGKDRRSGVDRRKTRYKNRNYNQKINTV